MCVAEIPSGTTEWSQVRRTEHPDDADMAHWRSSEFGVIRVSVAKYTLGDDVDHWPDMVSGRTAAPLVSPSCR